MENLDQVNECLEELSLSLQQVDALVDVISSADLAGITPNTLCHYLLVLNGSIFTAKLLCAQALRQTHSSKML